MISCKNRFIVSHVIAFFIPSLPLWCATSDSVAHAKEQAVELEA